MTLLVLLLATIGAELLARAVLRFAGSTYDSQACRDELRAIAASMVSGDPESLAEDAFLGTFAIESRPILHPYTGWTTAAYIGNELEDLVAYAPGVRNADTYVVLIVGGSVAAKFQRHGAHLLQQALTQSRANEPSHRVVVLNHGRGGYKQPQQLHLVSALLSRGLRPDLIVNIDGFNEVAAGCGNRAKGISPYYPAFQFWTHLTGGDTVLDREVLEDRLLVLTLRDKAATLADRATGVLGARFALSGVLLRAEARGVHTAWVSAQKRFSDALLRASGGPTLIDGSIGPDGPAADIDIARIWEESSRSLAALCRSRGADYLHVLQPTLTDPGTKPLTPAEVDILEAGEGSTTHVDVLYPLLRDAAVRLRAEGVSVLDAQQGIRE